MGGHQVVLLLEDQRLVLKSQRYDLKISVSFCKRFQRGFVTLILIFTKGRVPGPVQALQIGCGKGQGGRGIIFVAPQQVMIKADSLEHWRKRLVSGARSGLNRRGRIPCEESFGRIQNGIVGRKLVIVLWFSRGLLSRRVEFKRF